MASAYNAEQLSAYESYVDLPVGFRNAVKPAFNIDYLTALHIHQLSHVPYENLLLHYSKEHTVALDPQILFKKIVTDARGRGGYCMENAILFNYVLNGLGFQVYMAGVRIRPRVDGVPGGDYTGWVHVVNIVTLPDGTKWMLDIAFGGDGPTKPVPLVSGHALQNLGTQEIRLLRGPLPKFSDQSQHYWIYQYRNSSVQDWNSLYAFPELEFVQADLRVMSHFTSTSTSTLNFQTRRVLAIRFLRGLVDAENGEDGIVGKVMLVDGDVKRNLGGKTALVTTCKTEGERIQALKEYFDITLTEDEINGIKGRDVELLGA